MKWQSNCSKLYKEMSSKNYSLTRTKIWKGMENKSMNKLQSHRPNFWFISFTHLFLPHNSKGYSTQLLLAQESSLYQPISHKHQLQYLISDTLLILDRKNISILMEYGSGKRDGEVKQWQSKGLEEQVEQLMDIAIGYFLLLYMPIKCKNTLTHKYVNCH